MVPEVSYLKRHARATLLDILYHREKYFKVFIDDFLEKKQIRTRRKMEQACSDKCWVGVPEGIRTPDLLIRSQTLYPAELLVLGAQL